MARDGAERGGQGVRVRGPKTPVGPRPRPAWNSPAAVGSPRLTPAHENGGSAAEEFRARIFRLVFPAARRDRRRMKMGRAAARQRAAAHGADARGRVSLGATSPQIGLTGVARGTVA